MRILPRNGSILRLWFPNMEKLNEYWRQHKALNLSKEYSISIEKMKLNQEDGYEFKIT